jgi:formylglycine-generating enzyme required for sulfatase activity
MPWEGQKHVKIGKPFAVSRYAVTRGEFAAFVQDSGHMTDGGCYTGDGSASKQQEDKSWRSPGFKQNDRQPVVCVNWGDATAYWMWLWRKTGKFYRLPSEAEREYVTRAGTTTPFWWGSSITPQQANYNGSSEPYKGGGSKGAYRGATVPVDSFEASPWGLYQVHGNVWEWTEDCWDDSNNCNPEDGSALTTGDCNRRVLRGGSWDSTPRKLRAAERGAATADERSIYGSFRVARTLNP